MIPIVILCESLSEILGNPSQNSSESILDSSFQAAGHGYITHQLQFFRVTSTLFAIIFPDIIIFLPSANPLFLTFTPFEKVSKAHQEVVGDPPVGKPRPNASIANRNRRAMCHKNQHQIMYS